MAGRILRSSYGARFLCARLPDPRVALKPLACGVPRSFLGSRLLCANGRATIAPSRSNTTATATATATASTTTSDADEFADTLPYESITALPGQLPYFGALPLMIKHSRALTMHEFHAGLRKFGSMVRYSLMGTKFLHLFDPKDIKQIFSIHQTEATRMTFDFWVNYRKDRGLPLGVAMLEPGQSWRDHRSVINRMMVPSVLAPHVGRVSDVASDFVNMIERFSNARGELEDPQFLASAYALESVCAVLLNRRINIVNAPTRADVPPTSKGMMVSLTGFFATTGLLMNSLPLYKWFATKDLREHYRYSDDMVRYSTILAQSPETRDPSVSNDMRDIDDGVPALLTEILDSAGERLTQAEKDVIVADLLNAASDTTSNVMIHVLYTLGTQPEAQKRLRAEVESVMGDSTVVTSANLNKMSYLKNFVSEAIRISPPLSNTVRLFHRDVVVGQPGSSYRIPAETVIFLDVAASGKCPAFVSRADQFDPDRHSRSAPPEERFDHFAGALFGHGARMCPGHRLARMEIEVALIQLVRAFDVYAPCMPPSITTLFTTLDVSKPGAVLLKFTRRAPAASDGVAAHA